MSIAVGELRKLFATMLAAVGVLAPVHMNMVLDIIQLTVDNAAVLADELLIQALRRLIVLDSLVVAEVVAIRVHVDVALLLDSRFV